MTDHDERRRIAELVASGSDSTTSALTLADWLLDALAEVERLRVERDTLATHFRVDYRQLTNAEDEIERLREENRRQIVTRDQQHDLRRLAEFEAEALRAKVTRAQELADKWRKGLAIMSEHPITDGHRDTLTAAEQELRAALADEGGDDA